MLNVTDLQLPPDVVYLGNSGISGLLTWLVIQRQRFIIHSLVDISIHYNFSDMRSGRRFRWGNLKSAVLPNTRTNTILTIIRGRNSPLESLEAGLAVSTGLDSRRLSFDDGGEQFGVGVPRGLPRGLLRSYNQYF